MPQPPSWVDKVNFITYWWTNPCDFGLEIYFRTALPATGKLVLSLLDFSIDDILRGYFRPKGTRSGRHGRRRPYKKGAHAFIPEIGEMIGKNLPGSEVVPNRAIDQGVEHLWRIDGWVQKWSYRLMIVDVVTDFIFDWWSGIITDPNTSCPAFGRMLRQGFPQELGGHGFGPLVLPFVKYQDGLESSNFGAILGPGKWFVTLSGKWHSFDYNPGDVEAQARLKFTDFHGNIEYVYSPRVTIPSGGGGQFMATKNIIGPCSVDWEQLFIGGNGQALETEAWIMKAGD